MVTMQIKESGRNKTQMFMIIGALVIVSVIAYVGWLAVNPTPSITQTGSKVNPLPAESAVAPLQTLTNTVSDEGRLNTMFAGSGANTPPVVTEIPVKATPIIPENAPVVTKTEEFDVYAELGQQQSITAETGAQQDVIETVSNLPTSNSSNEIMLLKTSVQTLIDRMDMLSKRLAVFENAPSIRNKMQAKVASQAISSSNKRSNKQPVYIVKKGDSLMEIAKRFNTKTGCLVAWNGLNKPDEIGVGNKIKLSGNSRCTLMEEWVKNSTVPRQGKKRSSVRSIASNGWQIMGMDTSSVAMTHDNGATFVLFQKDDDLPGVGKIMALDYDKQHVITSNGTVTTLFN